MYVCVCMYVCMSYIYSVTICYTIVYILSCFYYTLGNIRPAYRSSLTSIFVLAVAKSSLLLEFTADAILERFVQQMNILSQVECK